MITVRICWDDGGTTDHGFLLKSNERFRIIDKPQGSFDPGYDKQIVARKPLMYEIVREHLSEFNELYHGNVIRHQVYEMTEEEFALLLLKI